jgi:hypothetical protein
VSRCFMAAPLPKGIRRANMWFSGWHGFVEKSKGELPNMW